MPAPAQQPAPVHRPVNALVGIHRGHPAIYDPTTGECAVVYSRSAAGWSKAVKLAVELARELRA